MQNPQNMKFSPQQQQELVRFQKMQQSLEVLTQQRITYESQVKEMENAVKELEAAPEDVTVYKSIGGIFVKKTRQELLESTNDRKQFVEMRLKNLTTQENQQRTSLEEYRGKVEKILKDAGYKQ